ncbi:MAG TPA: hypothetical protein VFZ25_17850 [Chloroflexota bacterium]|nr:hypothetical protein [Chloroflexota bacterium]
MADNPRMTIRGRLVAAGVKVENLEWFLSMATPEDLENLPADAIYVAGQRTPAFRETLINLRTGQPVYLPEIVPSGTAYCLLNPLKPFMRTEAKRPTG